MPAELKRNILITKLGTLLFYLILPLIIVSDTYKVFNDNPPYIRITGGLIMSVIIIFYFLRNFIRKFINWLSPGPFRKVIKSIYKSLPIIIIACIMRASLDAYKTFVTCYTWIAASLVIGNIIDAFDDDYVQEWKEIKLTKRQDKYRRKYNI